MTQCLLLRPVGRAQKEPLELAAAAGRAMGSSALPAPTPPDSWGEKLCIKIQENFCSVSVWFDSWFNFFVLTQHSVAEFCIPYSQRADDLLFLYYYSWFQQPASQEQRRSAGGVFVEIYSWDLVGEWFGEKRGRAFSMVSWEVKMYSACNTAPCYGEVCLQRVLIQKWARCKVSKLPGRDGVEENVWRVGGVEWGVASGEGGLTMGVQEEDAQVYPDPLPEPLVVYRQWGFWPQRTAETPPKEQREVVFGERM